MVNNDYLKTELETYEREKDRLVSENEGHFVVISDTRVVGIWDTYEDALKAGYKEFGLKPFLVKQILGIDKIHSFTRDLVPCQS